MKNDKTLALVWLAIILAIIAFSLIPQFTFQNKYHLDKIAHFTGYLIAAIASINLFKQKYKITLAGFILVIMAFSTELAQIYIPGRTASYGDAAANITGVIVGIIISYLFSRYKK